MPNDPTPLGDEMVRRMPERKFPQPKPGAGVEDAAPDIAHRPALPDHPVPMAADIEDEEADPVTDIGPGIADGADKPKKQRG